MAILLCHGPRLARLGLLALARVRGSGPSLRRGDGGYADPVAGIVVSVDIAAPRAEVWKEVADLGSHAEWMADAESIEFLSSTRRGAGVRMEVATRVGPLRTRDIIEVIEWVEGERIGARHLGLVAGVGSFELAPLDPALTRFTWREDLAFPWFLGGRLTARIAAPILAAVWRRNLRIFRERIEGRTNA